jgi:AcrR family transcriptional regulator
MVATAARREGTEALLDAAEILLVKVGYAAITTRNVAEEAGVNHGLVHYYFGSMEELFLQTLERYTARLTKRQREMYAAPLPFLEKWRAAMRYLDEDLESGYQKVWFELQAMAWNRPPMRTRIARTHGSWLEVLRPAFAAGMDELGIDRRQFSAEAMVALVATFNQGVILERLSGADSGHAVLLASIDRWLTGQQRSARARRRGKKDAPRA